VGGALLTAGSSIDAQEIRSRPDSSLRAGLRLFVAQNQELASRRAAVSAAEARVRAAGFSPAAVLVAEGEEIPNGIDLSNAGSLRVGIERELMTSGRRTAMKSAAQADLSRAEAALVATEQRLVATAEQTLIRVTASSAISRRLAAEDSLLARAEDALRTRFAVGDARYVDVLRIRTERLRVGTERAEAVADVRASSQTLMSLIGDSLSRPGAILDSLENAVRQSVMAGPLPPAPNIDSLLASAGAIRTADADLRRAEAMQRLVIAEQSPRVTASIGAQRFRLEAGSPTIGPTLGATITLPFTARRQSSALLQSARHELESAAAGRRATLATLRGTLLAARERYESARARFSVYETALLTGALNERETALAGYRGGELSLVELIDFERALARAETDRLRSRIAAADALADIYIAAATSELPRSAQSSAMAGGER